MIKLEDIQAKVQRFLETEFPEIASDADETGVRDEIAHVLFTLLTGDDDYDDDEVVKSN